MKIEITLEVKGLRCLKGLFTTFLRILFNSKEKTALYLIYFCESKQMRFLIDSEYCNGILAIDPRITIADNSSTKENAQLLVIQFKQGNQILQAFCDLADKQGFGEITLTLSKDKPLQGEEPFRSLNLYTKIDKFRSQIFKPLYDPPSIVNHLWLNGCASMQQKKVQFDMDTQHIMNLLRVIYRDKQSQNDQKMITVSFMFLKDKYVARLEKLHHTAEGEVMFSNFSSAKFEGNYYYKIQPQNAGHVYEMLLGKSSGSRLFINIQNHLVFSYFQQGVYESQVVTRQWIEFDSFQAKQKPTQTKLQM